MKWYTLKTGIYCNWSGSWPFFRCTMMMKALSNNIYELLSCLNRAISEDIDYQIAYKILDLGYSLRTGNRMLCYNESHSLLLKWLITFLRCIKKVGGFLFNIYKPLIVHAVPSTALVGSQIAHKMSDLGYPIIMGNGMLGYKVWYPLLLDWVISYFRCVRQIGGTFSSIHKSLIVHCFYPGWLSSCTQNDRFWVPSL